MKTTFAPGGFLFRIRVKFWPSLFFFFGALALASASDEFILADKTQARPITIHPEASELLRSVAEDLARITEGMIGKRPEIIESTDPQGIIIGTTAQFGVFKDDPGLAIRDIFDGREAFIIRPEPKKNQLWILGNQEDGASHGVYTLLRDHGYRALFPGKNWEVIPRLEKIAVSKPSEGRPKVLTRLIWAGFGSFDKEQSIDVDTWRRRNRMGASITGQIGHSWESIIRHNKELFEANPQLYGEKADGTPNKLSLRHGTQAVVDMTVDVFRKRLTDSPNKTDILSLAPTDGDNYSRDKETSAKGDISESFYWYVNAVAKQMLTIAPDKLVGTTAYYLHAKPPPFNLEPNVIVLGATQFGSGGLSLEDFFAAWSKRAKYLGIRDYIYSGYQFVADHPNGGYREETLERQAQWVRNFPISYYSAEGLWEWGVRGIGYYALAQLLWDPSQQVSDILKDFRKSAYGPGAEAMHAYYEALDPKGKAVRKHQMARGIIAIQEAAKAAKGDPQATARIDDMKMYLVHVALLDKMQALQEDDPARWALVADDLEWNYRNRRSYIFNYNCNRRPWMVNKQQLGNFLLRERNVFSIPGEEKPANLEEQSAVFARILGEKWRIHGGMLTPSEAVAQSLQPAAAEEIREKFEKIVVPQYPPIEVDEISYSKDYVPVDTGLQPKESGDATTWFGASPRFLLWRAQPDSLSWRVTPNVRYPDRVGKLPLKISVEQPDGESTPPVELVQDTQPKDASVKIAQPGLSEVFFHTARMGMMLEGKQWEYLTLPTDENTIVFIGTLPRGSTQAAKPIYFYVPKGIREIQAFAESRERVIKDSIFSPVDGEPVVPQIDGELLKIAVTSGQDGKMWKIDGGGLGVRFYFLNLPNLLCFHPGKILLPREVAVQDHLHIVE